MISPEIHSKHASLPFLQETISLASTDSSLVNRTAFIHTSQDILHSAIILTQHHAYNLTIG